MRKNRFGIMCATSYRTRARCNYREISGCRQRTNSLFLPFVYFPFPHRSRVLHALQFQKCRDSTRTQTLLNIEKLCALPKRPYHAWRFTYMYLRIFLYPPAYVIMRVRSRAEIRMLRYPLWRKFEIVLS